MCSALDVAVCVASSPAGFAGSLERSGKGRAASCTLFLKRAGRDSNPLAFRISAAAKTKRPAYASLNLWRGGLRGMRPHRLVLQAGRAGFEPAAEFNPSTHLAGEPNRPLWHLPEFSYQYSVVSHKWSVALQLSVIPKVQLITDNCKLTTSSRRRERDSNPRWVSPHLFSRQAP